MVQGILVAAIAQAERASRGKSGMRNNKLSDLELSLMAEAGVVIAVAASNQRLVREFGLAFTVPKIPIDNTHAFSLPSPFLAHTARETLLENSLVIDNHINHIAVHPAEPSDDSVPQPAVAASRRCLTLAFDKTYILQSPDVVKLDAGRGFVGGAWQCPFGTEGANSKDASFLPLRAEGSEGSKLAESGEDEGQVALDAANILDLESIFDKSSTVFPLQRTAGVRGPCCANASPGRPGAGWAPHVKTLAFDNASNHILVKCMLTGQSTGLPAMELRRMPFWNRVVHQPLPDTCLPRFPFSAVCD